MRELAEWGGQQCLQQQVVTQYRAIAVIHDGAAIVEPGMGGSGVEVGVARTVGQGEVQASQTLSGQP